MRLWIRFALIMMTLLAWTLIYAQESTSPETCLAQLEAAIAHADSACAGIAPGQYCRVGQTQILDADGQATTQDGAAAELQSIITTAQMTFVSAAPASPDGEMGVILLWGVDQHEDGTTTPGAMVILSGYTTARIDDASLSNLYLETGAGDETLPCADAGLGHITIVTPDDETSIDVSLRDLEGLPITDLSLSSGVQITTDDVIFAAFVLFGDVQANFTDPEGRERVGAAIALAAADVLTAVNIAQERWRTSDFSRDDGLLMMHRLDVFEDMPRGIYFEALWNGIFDVLPDDREASAKEKTREALSEIAPEAFRGDEDIEVFVLDDGPWCIVAAGVCSVQAGYIEYDPDARTLTTTAGQLVYVYRGNNTYVRAFTRDRRTLQGIEQQPWEERMTVLSPRLIHREFVSLIDDRVAQSDEWSLDYGE